MDRYRNEYKNDDRIFDTQLHKIYTGWKQEIKTQTDQVKIARHEEIDRAYLVEKKERDLMRKQQET